MKVTSIHRPEHAALVQVLRTLRLKAGLTQSAVADRLKVAQTTVSDIEIGERGVDYLLVRDLCQIYGVTIQSVDKKVDKALAGEGVETPPRLVRQDKRLR